jgi:hypothetical protein
MPDSINLISPTGQLTAVTGITNTPFGPFSNGFACGASPQGVSVNHPWQLFLRI